MPQSLVLNLVTQSAIPRQHLQGYSLQQLFFNLVEVVDPELGHVLRRDKQNRGYSLSALQLSHPSEASPSDVLTAQKLRLFLPKAKVCQLQYSHSESIAAQTSCWWRISFLDDALFDHLIFLWNQLQGEVFQLGSGSVAITNIATDMATPLPTGQAKLDWASRCSYRDLYEQASAQERDIHLEFVTPTAFECQGHVNPLPTAEAVFQPLRRRWNRYGGLAFVPSVVMPIVPLHFNIQTHTVQSSLRNSMRSIVGCTGQISFRISGDGDPLTIKRINALADFTRYCSIGSNTLFGMGVVRRLSSAAMTLRRSQSS
jgi:CRISPR-associated endoribonuclease Cas6